MKQTKLFLASLLAITIVELLLTESLGNIILIDEDLPERVVGPLVGVKVRGIVGCIVGQPQDGRVGCHFVFGINHFSLSRYSRSCPTTVYAFGVRTAPPQIVKLVRVYCCPSKAAGFGSYMDCRAC